MLKNNALEQGLTIAQSENTADIFILNSCSITDKAQRKTNKLLRNITDKYPKKKVVITGCGVRDEHKKYAVVVKNEEKDDLFLKIGWISQNHHSDSPLCHSERSEESRDPLLALKDDELSAHSRTRLMYKVQEGCNNLCAYCIVPYLRGRERSTNPETVVKDLQKAEKEGYKEVVLCGVNVGQYNYTAPVILSEAQAKNPFKNKEKGFLHSSFQEVGRNDSSVNTPRQAKKFNLADLIKIILNESPFPRIRLSSINPDDLSNDLINLWAQNDRLCPHFHISLQSGSDSVLKRMGRKYDTEQYSGLVSKIREQIPDVQITTDVIVGFPGETEEEFAETINFVKKMKFLKVHVFRYSPREGTRAAKMSDQIQESIKKDRAVKLQKLEAEIRQKILQGYVGKEVEVLFEPSPLSFRSASRSGESKNPLVSEQSNYYSGYTKNYIKVSKNSNSDLTNKIVGISIIDISGDGFTG